MSELKKLATLFAILLAFAFSSPATAENERLKFWVGAGENGIYAGELDVHNGALSNIRPVIAGIEAHYIAGHPDKPVVYAAIRTGGPSRIAAYQVSSNGDLILLNELGSLPHGISHITISQDGRFIGAAFYRTGVAGVYRLNDDGSMGLVFGEAQQEGSSVNAGRQEASHPHWAGFSHDIRFMYVTDLGTDHIWVYELKEPEARLDLVQKAPVSAGAGPRNIAIHPGLDVVYVSEELTARVSRYALDRENGKLSYLDAMQPAAEAAGETWHTVSDIRIHPSGKFLYLVNRGFDRVSVFAIDPESGQLTAVEQEPVRGSVSRSIAFDDSGRWALVAGSESHTLAVFEIDQANGKLRYIRQIGAVPTPMAIVVEPSR